MVFKVYMVMKVIMILIMVIKVFIIITVIMLPRLRGFDKKLHRFYPWFHSTLVGCSKYKWSLSLRSIVNTTYLGAETAVRVEYRPLSGAAVS